MTKSNTLSPIELSNEIEAIAAEREAWETGSYKKSNEELYTLLERCMNIFAQVKDSVKLRNRLNIMLNDRNMPYNTSTSTLTKIVRLVFGDCGKRAYTYARVLKVAIVEKPENKSLAAFVADAGGIEEVRRTQKGQTPSQKRYTAISMATEWFANKPAVLKVESSDELAPNTDATHTFSLAVVRQEADGTQSIVYGINNQALLNKALEFAGKQQSSKKTVEREVSIEEIRTKKRNAAISNLTAA